MRILRMEIPMAFTMEYLETEILKVVGADGLLDTTCLITLSVFRDSGQDLKPLSNTIGWFISGKVLSTPFYTISDNPYEVELFKDFYVNQDMLSNLNSNNKVAEVVATIFANENGYSDSLLLNTVKNVVGTPEGVLFLVKDSHLKTPPLSDGVKNTVIRKKLIEMIEKLEYIQIEESSISPFELQKADELFFVNISKGIVPITKYRKKAFGIDMAKDLMGKLNAQVRLANLK